MVSKKISPIFLIFALSTISAAATDSVAVISASTQEAPAIDSVSAPAQVSEDTASVVAPVDSVTTAVADTTVAADTTAAVPPVSQEQPADTAKAAEPVDETTITTASASSADSTSIYATSQMSQTPAPVAQPRKGWTHLLGVGATVPVAQYKAHGNKIDLINYGANITYLGMARCGFSLKASVSAGGSATDNIKFVDSKSDWQIGSYAAAELGIGYSFGSPAGFSLSVVPLIGIESATFVTEEKKYKHAELGNVDRSYSESLAALTLGGDILVRVALANHVGLFASVGGRWASVVATASSVYFEKDDFSRTESYTDDDVGNYSIVPTVGVMWGF